MLLYIIVLTTLFTYCCVYLQTSYTVTTLVHTHILVLYLFTCTCTHPTSYIIYTYSPHITANMHMLLYISYHTSILSHISYARTHHCSLIRLVHNCTYSSCRYIFYITVHIHSYCNLYSLYCNHVYTNIPCSFMNCADFIRISMGEVSLEIFRSVHNFKEYYAVSFILIGSCETLSFISDNVGTHFK